MKPSLEEERRALLEQIEASRAVYRRMLANEPGSRGTRASLHLSGHVAAQSSRNRALQWAMAHPLWVAGGVALLVLLAPRAIVSTRRAAALRKSARQPAAPATSGGTLRALLTVAALLLRDPARMRAATSLAGSAWHWLKERRRAARPAPLPAAAVAPRPAPPLR